MLAARGSRYHSRVDRDEGIGNDRVLGSTRMPAVAGRALALLLALALRAGNACAWGEEGHRMVGAIAERFLGATARARVALLLEDDRLADGERSNRHSLAEVANWADEIRETPRGRRRGSWHFDNVPLCGAADRASYCALGRCASAQLERNIAILGNAKLPVRRRNEALKWVVHLMADIHQPLHAATRGDRGGNALQVSFFGRRDDPRFGPLNLHAIWDVHMVQRLVREKGGERAVVAAPIAAADKAAWERASIPEVIGESHGIAEQFVYPALGGKSPCSAPPRGVVPVAGAYFATAAPVVEDRLRRAGVRLAKVLNDTLGDR